MADLQHLWHNYRLQLQLHVRVHGHSDRLQPVNHQQQPILHAQPIAVSHGHVPTYLGAHHQAIELLELPRQQISELPQAIQQLH